MNFVHSNGIKLIFEVGLPHAVLKRGDEYQFLVAWLVPQSQFIRE
jgi:hypothetical protein